ncbi:MAG: hypothetical protein K2K74_07080 [Lachnospiraceae bacterium]|nr:hypothetical protein [Lachnospiraceae bacterium]
MEVEILKNDLEIAKQKLELANKELESKDKIIEQMNETIDILKWRVEVQESMISQIKDIADKLLEKVEKGQVPLIGKKDIMEIFNKESDFALRFLRVAKSIGFGIQVGKEYYIKREEFEKMLNTYQGLKLEI